MRDRGTYSRVPGGGVPTRCPYLYITQTGQSSTDWPKLHGLTKSMSKYPRFGPVWPERTKVARSTPTYGSVSLAYRSLSALVGPYRLGLGRLSGPDCTKLYGLINTVPNHQVRYSVRQVYSVGPGWVPLGLGSGSGLDGQNCTD